MKQVNNTMYESICQKRQVLFLITNILNCWVLTVLTKMQEELYKRKSRKSDRKALFSVFGQSNPMQYNRIEIIVKMLI